MRIEVKSYPEYFDKEKKQLKPCTMRRLDGEDILQITNTETGEKIEKLITDISIYKGWLMISFKPKDKKLLKVTKSNLELPQKSEEKRTYKKREKMKRGPYKKKEKPKPGKRPGRQRGFIDPSIKCPKCGSRDIVRSGMRPKGGGLVQTYRCKKCGSSKFTPEQPIRKVANKELKEIVETKLREDKRKKSRKYVTKEDQDLIDKRAFKMFDDKKDTIEVSEELGITPGAAAKIYNKWKKERMEEGYKESAKENAEVAEDMENMNEEWEDSPDDF